MAMALEGAAAGVHGHRWLLKADLALCLRIGVLNCGSNVHVQLFSSSRASRPLSSHDLVRPSAVHFLHTHTHIVLRQVQEATVVGFVGVGFMCTAT